MKDYDLTAGFVLHYDEAIAFLEDTAQAHTTAVMNGDEDSEGMTEILDDLYTMKQDIMRHDYEYIKFVECPMSASNINIIPMVEKE